MSNVIIIILCTTEYVFDAYKGICYLVLKCIVIAYLHLMIIFFLFFVQARESEDQEIARALAASAAEATDGSDATPAAAVTAADGSSSSSSSTAIAATDNSTAATAPAVVSPLSDADITEVMAAGFSHDEAVSSLTQHSGDKTQAIAALFAKKFAFN